MKTTFLTFLATFIFQGCTTTQDKVQVNNIPPKTTHVKAEAPGEPSYRGTMGARYVDTIMDTTTIL